jgi:hypothetical protein
VPGQTEAAAGVRVVAGVVGRDLAVVQGDVLGLLA